VTVTLISLRFLPLCLALLTLTGSLAVPAAHASMAADHASAHQSGTASAHTSEILADKLGSPDPTIRRHAAAALADQGLAALPDLERALASPSAERRRGAALGLGLLSIPALAEDALLNAMADPDVAVRSMAARSAAQAGPILAPSLVALLAAPDPNQRNAAAYALTLMGGPAVDALARGLATDNPFARAKAAWLLGHMGEEAVSAIPALVRALDSTDPRVTHVVAEAIDLIGPNPGLVWHHLMLLGGPSGGFPLKRTGSRAAPILVRLLARPGTPLAQIAFHALAAIGPDALPALRLAVKDGSPSQRTAAALLLSDIDPDSVLALPEDLRQSLSGARHKQ
jgi:HEAT repeat protein